ncbi:uracil-DNA glycosylase [Loktanella sp. 1ANDIMAR09]|nr:uracil-DNA glycosylase [Loktanella sp. 1ANDIMAR09]
MKHSEVQNSAEDFVSRLAEAKLPNVFNPYSDVCAIHDEPNAACKRRTNLSSALSSALNLNVRTIWIARDLGYRGGRRTGLALTDEAHLLEHGRLLGGVDFMRATRGPEIKERTASVIWHMIMRIDEPLFLWNAFPLHPHLADNPMTNRCHTSGERNAMSWVLHELLDILKPDQVFTIGGDARRCVMNLGVESVAFRHPSYGGKTQFIQEVEKAYGLKGNAAKTADESRQLTLI